MKTKIQIKSIFGSVLFELEKENNCVKDTIIAAVERSANLRSANLYGANLRSANLRSANLYGANLRSADLCGADLYGANLRGADLYGANLRGADLYGANLRSANLYGADLYGANLYGADLCGANLYGANLRSANLPFIPLNCPSDGAFIGWKKVQNKLVKLLIPEDARRSSATTHKCRCDKAVVLSITSLDEQETFNSVINKEYCPYVEYKAGEIVVPDSFDENRWEECSHGIHFFINKQSAIEY